MGIFDVEVNKIYNDTENQVMVFCSKNFVEYYVYNKTYNQNFRYYKIDKFNLCTISDLMERWVKNNWIIGDIDLINKVSKNCLLYDFNYVLENFPTCVIDEEDIDKIMIEVYAPKLGIFPATTQQVYNIAKLYVEHLKKIQNDREESYYKSENLCKKLFGKNYDYNRETILVENVRRNNEGVVCKSIPAINVNSCPNLGNCNQNNKKLLQIAIEECKSISGFQK